MMNLFYPSLFLAAVVGVLVSFPETTTAYPSGAGACPAGAAAVGGPHGSGGTTPLSQAGLTVSLDGKALSPGTAASFTTGQDHTITLQGGQFEGVLFRLGSAGGVGTTNALSVKSGDSTLRLASDTCIPQGAGGVTHTSKNRKTSSSITLRLNSPASNLPLDITVVTSGIGNYVYSRFLLNAVAGTTGSTPVAPPVASPVAKPVSAPVRPSSPTRPVSRPVRRPVRKPIRRQPTRRPVARPVLRPFSSPVSSPFERPSHEGGDDRE